MILSPQAKDKIQLSVQELVKLAKDGQNTNYPVFVDGIENILQEDQAERNRPKDCNAINHYGEPCKNNAVDTIDGVYYCWVHKMIKERQMLVQMRNQQLEANKKC